MSPSSCRPITSVPLRWHGCALFGSRLVDIVPIDPDVPPLNDQIERSGGDYANDASLLCGNWLCGGSLDFPARSDASRRPSHSVPVSGTSVESCTGLGARPVAPPFRRRAPIASCPSGNCYRHVTHLPFERTDQTKCGVMGFSPGASLCPACLSSRILWLSASDSG